MNTAYTEGDALAVISSFASVFERHEFRAELDRLARDAWQWGAPLALRHRPLKAHRLRCTFELSVHTLHGWHSLIGKVHVKDRSDVFRSMAAIQAAGFGAAAEYSIPQPLAFLSGLHVLLEEKVPGGAAKAVFLEGRPQEQLVAAERSGRWLARFHCAAPRLGTPADPEHDLQLYRHWADKITGTGVPFATKAVRLVERLAAAAPGGRADACRAGHGSYMPEHVMLSPGRTAVIDFDELDVADPARDVACFIVSLQRLALHHGHALHSFDHLLQRFLETYVGEAPVGATKHVAFYQAAEYLHRARRDLFKRIPPAPDSAELMLDEGLRRAPDP